MTERDAPDIRGAARFANGEIVVADGRHGRLCFYGPDGRLRFRFGQFGHGDTSNEFDFITGVFRQPNDIVAIADARTNRVTGLNSGERVVFWSRVDAAPVTQTTMGRSRGMVRIQGRFLDGSFLGELQSPSVFSQQAIGTDSMDAVLVHSDGHYAPLAHLLQGSWFFFTGMPVVAGTPSVQDDLPFGRSGRIAVGPRSWFYTDGGAYEIRERSPTNKLLAVIRLNQVVGPVTPADIQHFRAAYVRQAAPDQHVVIERALRWVTYPAVKPAYIDLRLDALGDLWAQRSGFADNAQQWDVFDAGGHYICGVSTPSDADVLDIGADYVLTRAGGPEHTPLVQLYRIRRTN